MSNAGGTSINCCLQNFESLLIWQNELLSLIQEKIKWQVLFTKYKKMIICVFK